jgi:hypothetical protein
MSGFKPFDVFRVFAVLSAFTLAALLIAADTALAQGSSPDNTLDQYDGEPAPDGLQGLAPLGIDGPEDFDYCDEAGCHILGPSGKEFFLCDPEWSCGYVSWESDLLGAGDFDYLEVQAEEKEYGEAGTGYVCGSGEVCLNVASYECDVSGRCVYYMAGQGGGLENIPERAGGEDAVPGAGDDARRALEGFTRALQRAPDARMKTALASETNVSSGAPPLSRDPSSASGSGGPNSPNGQNGPNDPSQDGGEAAQAESDTGPADADDPGDSDGSGGEGAKTGSENDGGESNGSDSSGAASGDSANGDSASGDSDPAGSGAAATDSTEVSLQPLSYVALGVGVLVLAAVGLVVAARYLW